MTAEGWNGRSIRQHVENAASLAAEALDAAQVASAEADTAAGKAARALGEIQGVNDDLRTLTQKVDALSERRRLAESTYSEIAALRTDVAELTARMGGANAAPLRGGRHD